MGSKSRRQEAVAVGQVRPAMAGQMRVELEWCSEDGGLNSGYTLGAVLTGDRICPEQQFAEDGWAIMYAEGHPT